MLRYRLPADRQFLSQLPDRAWPIRQALHDREPAGITQCLPASMGSESRHERKLRLTLHFGQDQELLQSWKRDATSARRQRADGRVLMRRLASRLARAI